MTMKKQLLFFPLLSLLAACTGTLPSFGESSISVPEGSHLVRFETRGGTPVSPAIIEDGKLLSIPTSIYQGFAIEGWYTSLNNGLTLNAAWNFFQDRVYTSFTLYAKWERQSFTISFETNGGLPIDPITALFDAEITLPLARKIRSNFVGWYRNNDLTTAFTSTKMPAENLTLYAKWDLILLLEDPDHNYFVTGNFAGWGDAPTTFEEDGTTLKYLLEPIGIGDERIDTVANQLINPAFLYLKEILLPSTAAGWNVKYVRTSGGTEETFDGNLTVKILQVDVDAEVPVPNYWAQNPESGVVNNLTPSTLYIPPFFEEAPYEGAGDWNGNPVALTHGRYYLVFGEQVFTGDTQPELFMGLIRITN